MTEAKTLSSNSTMLWATGRAIANKQDNSTTKKVSENFGSYLRFTGRRELQKIQHNLL
ncbi:MAG: hypothetical protein AAGE84_02400 [Cyanobacteria bacterium P01_G01_bin.39]